MEKSIEQIKQVEDELLSLIKQRLVLVDCEIADTIKAHNGNLVNVKLDRLIKKKKAYELVISDLKNNWRLK